MKAAGCIAMHGLAEELGQGPGQKCLSSPPPSAVVKEIRKRVVDAQHAQRIMGGKVTEAVLVARSCIIWA